MNPTPLFVGIGLRAQAPASALHGLWQQALAQLPQPWRVQAVATLPHKAQHPALRAWLTAQGWGPALAAPPEALTQCTTLTQSAQALARYGCGSVAEAAALWAAVQASPGPLRLLGPRWVAADGSATLAVAQVVAQIAET